MSTSRPAPLQSFLGGIGLALPVHALLILNGSIFGISGFLHRAARGGKEGAVSVLGFVLGGVVVGELEGIGPKVYSTHVPTLVASGILVGLGTKLGNGCTSGHMICGLSRFSFRSIVATTVFCATGVLTTNLLYSTSLPPVGSADISLGQHGSAFFAGSLLSLLCTILVPYLTPSSSPQTTQATSIRRLFISFLAALSFSLSLRLSNLTDPTRVLSFLLLPPHPAFDPSLVFLALGAIPLAATLYYRSSQKVNSPSGGKIDWRLVTGAALFGIGWGIEGICPGPGLVNFGQALATGSDIQPLAIWLASVIAGGLIAP